MKTADETRRLLVVEDDRELRTLLIEHFCERGLEARAADCLGCALEELRSPFALVISDLWLPDGSALELLDRLRAASASPKVIVMSAIADSEMQEKVLASGACAYMDKPFKLAELDARVAQALRH